MVASFFSNGFQTRQIDNKIFHFTKDENQCFVLHSIFELEKSDLSFQKTSFQFNGTSLLVFYHEHPMRIISKTVDRLLNTQPFRVDSLLSQVVGFQDTIYNWLIDLKYNNVSKSTIVQEDVDILLPQPLQYTEYARQIIIQNE